MKPVAGLLVALILLGCPARVAAQSFEERLGPAVDALVARALSDSGAPSASVAVVEDGRIVFARAYGSRSFSPVQPATPDDRYLIGSASKTFTAAIALMLAEEGQLSLDEPVGRLAPETTDAQVITLRQALSHTAGYRGYFTADATPVEGRQATTPQTILGRWGAAPLDAPPGTAWNYSNTGYTVAGVMVERASGVALADLLHNRIFTPLGMSSAEDMDRRERGATDATGYTRYLLGPSRVARPVGAGWTFAAGGLAMSASDLARADIALMDGALLSPASLAAMTTDTLLSNGEASGYGLGLYVDKVMDQRRWRHDGSIDGFGAENRLYPDRRAAVVVLVNADYGQTPVVIANGIETLLLGPPVRAFELTLAAPLDGGKAELDLVATLLEQLRTGQLDRSRLTEDAEDYYSAEAATDYRESLAAIAGPVLITQMRRDFIGGLDASLYTVKFGERTLIAILRLTPDGKVASFVVFPA